MFHISVREHTSDGEGIWEWAQYILNKVELLIMVCVYASKKYTKKLITLYFQLESHCSAHVHKLGLGGGDMLANLDSSK